MKKIVLILSIALLSIACIVFTLKQVTKNGYADSGMTADDSEMILPVSGRIVFQSNREGSASEIWLLKEGQIHKIADGGKPKGVIPKELPNKFAGMFASALGQIAEPRWSHDGEQILCTYKDSLVILSPEGDKIKEVKTSKPTHEVDWGYDGKSIYYAANDPSPSGGGSYNIYKHDLVTGVESKMTDLEPLPGTRRILEIKVSPDGSKIAFVGAGLPNVDGISIWTVNSDGSNLNLDIKYSADTAWSPDGSKLAYASSYYQGKKVSNFDHIWIYDLGTKKTTRVTNNPWSNRYPAFSPDGKQIVFSSARHEIATSGSELFAINIDGTNEIQLTAPKHNPEQKNNPFRAWASDTHPDWI